MRGESVFGGFRNVFSRVNSELQTRLKGSDSNGYEELGESIDRERNPEEQYRLRKQLADRQNEITVLNARINELENSTRRKTREEKKEEVEKEEDDEEKGDGEDINQYLLSSKKK